MKLFNAVQIVALHAAAPLLISLIPEAYWPGVWVAWVFYLILTCVMVGALYTAIEEWEK